MSRSSIKHVNRTYLWAHQGGSASLSSSNSVIYGRFPETSNRRFSVDKLNKFLMMILMCLVVISVISYYFVSDGEKRMNKLGHEIVALTNENIELQNKIDNLHSFNKVDVAIHSKTMLDTAKKVIEIPASKIVATPKAKERTVNYNWSIGY